MSLDFPQGAVNYPNCTLHVETPDKNALWLEFNFYIRCQVNPGEEPYNYYKFNFPVTITIDYSQLPAAFLDESRLTISPGSVIRSAGTIHGGRRIPAGFHPICTSTMS